MAFALLALCVACDNAANGADAEAIAIENDALEDMHGLSTPDVQEDSIRQSGSLSGAVIAPETSQEQQDILQLEPAVTPEVIIETPAAQVFMWEASATDLSDLEMQVQTEEPAATPSPTPRPTATPAPTYELTAVKNEKAYVKAHDVNLRKGPGESYEKIQTVSYLTSIIITAKTTIGENGEEHVWYRVEFDDITGFMRKDFVELGAVPVPEATSTPSPTKAPDPVPEKEADEEERSSANEIAQGSPGNYSEADIYLAAKLIYAEGKNQSRESFLAMANVLYNRCNSSKFGGTVTEEIYRSNQFTVVKYDSFEGLVPSASALSAAEDVFNNGTRVLPDNVMFFRSASNGKSWGSRSFYKEIGGNNYYS